MDLNLRETELTLGLPGEASRPTGDKFGSKREFFNTSLPKVPPAKAQVVGWPPVKEHRKNAMKHNFVKVAADGAPYLRKVDLEMYSSYEQLLDALQNLFSCFSICHRLDERKLVDAVNGSEYVPTYEDRDGDWMLVGDVPWRMFVESCKRLRLMKSSDAMGLIN